MNLNVFDVPDVSFALSCMSAEASGNMATGVLDSYVADSCVTRLPLENNVYVFSVSLGKSRIHSVIFSFLAV